MREREREKARERERERERERRPDTNEKNRIVNAISETQHCNIKKIAQNLTQLNPVEKLMSSFTFCNNAAYFIASMVMVKIEV